MIAISIGKTHARANIADPKRAVWSGSTVFRVHQAIIGSILYNRAIIYKRQNFLKIVIHVIIIDQCNQTAR